MRVLDILNLKPRRLNHHEEVYSQEAIPEAASRQQELGRTGCTAAASSQPPSGAAVVVDDRASTVVDRRPAGPYVAAIRRTTADDGRRIGGWPGGPGAW